MRLAQDEVVESIHRPSARYLAYATLPHTLTAVLLAAVAIPPLQLPAWIVLLSPLALAAPGALLRARRGRAAFAVYLTAVVGATLGFVLAPELGADAAQRWSPAGAAIACLAVAAWTGPVLRGRGIVVTNQGLHFRPGPLRAMARVPHAHLQEVTTVREGFATTTLILEIGDGLVVVPGLRDAAVLRERLLVRRDTSRAAVPDRDAVSRLRALVEG